jgi:amidophosphoribosyltransferase
MIGVDSLGYLSASDLPKLVNNSCRGLCDACFTGRYPVDISGVSEKSKFDRKINFDNKED